MTEPLISIKLRQYRENGWSFILSFTDPNTGERITNVYRTNAEGQGLWLVSPEDRKILGTCEFSLPHQYVPAYSKIRRWCLQSFVNEL